jgi:hypothetical protein
VSVFLFCFIMLCVFYALFSCVQLSPYMPYALLSWCAGGPMPTGPAAASSLSRFFFLLGAAAMQHLVLVERLSKAITARRGAAQKAALEQAEAAPAGGGGSRRGGKGQAAAGAVGGKDDIAAQLGVGSVAADAELDLLTLEVEHQVGL